MQNDWAYLEKYALENQKLLKPVDNSRERENAGYKALEKLSKGSNTLSR